MASYGQYQYESTESRALKGIKADSYNKDQAKNLIQLNQNSEYMAQYLRKLQKGVDEANKNVVEQLQSFISDVLVLLAGGNGTQIDFGDLKYIFQMIGALFGFTNSDGSIKLPPDLFGAAWHFFSTYIVPVGNFGEVINTLIDNAIAGILDAFGEIPVIGEALQQLAVWLTDLRDLINGFTDWLGPFFDLSDFGAGVKKFFEDLFDFNFSNLGDFIHGLIEGGILAVINAANIVGELLGINIPGLDGSKIISGMISQTFLNITNIAGNLISGLINDISIPFMDASKIITGTLNAILFPNITRGMSGDLQGLIDAGLNAIRNTPGVIGQAFEQWEASLASIPTSIFNKFGGNNAPRASAAQAADALASIKTLVTNHTVQITDLQNIQNGADGFLSSTVFRQPEEVAYTGGGSFTYTLPSWFVLGTDWLDGILLGAGGGAQGSNFGVPGANGTDGGNSTLVVNGTTTTGAGGVGNGTLTKRGEGPGPFTYMDILYPGGAHENTDGASGNDPGGGGCAVLTGVGVARGGQCGVWNTVSVIPTSATITGVCGVRGNGGGGTHPGGRGANGFVGVRARPALPSQFTPMGTLILPTFKLNSGVALTDSMTAVGTWTRVPPGVTTGGDMLIIRANSTFTSYVYLKVWIDALGVTHYALGRVSSGVTATPWKTGTLAAAIPFSAFSLSSDNAYTFTIGINGGGFDSFDDAAHSSSMGATFRTGGFATSDAGAPGSIAQFTFLDTGTPSRITSNVVATSQGLTSITYADLATIGPSVTIDVPPSGEVVVDFSAGLTTSGIGASGYMGFAMTGANTAAASDARSASARSGAGGGLVGTISRKLHLTNLTPGTTTFKAMYKSSVAASTATFVDRNITVDPKP